MRSLFSLFAASAALVALFASPLLAHAQVSAVPNALNFQGRLATPSGNPVPDGTYSVRFSLWDALTGGTEKWNKTVASIVVKNGTFAVALDGFASDTFNGNLWLEVKIGNDAALTPRTLLVSVPYAIKSNLALTVPDGSITANKFASGVLNSTSWLLAGNSSVTGGFLGTTDTQPLIFKTNSVERMRILSSGNVGIGTSAAEGTLDVRGNTVTDYLLIRPQNTQFEGGEMQLKGANTYPNWHLDAFMNTFRIFDDTGGTVTTIPFCITSDANVGIGTTTPQAKFDVNGAGWFVSNQARNDYYDADHAAVHGKNTAAGASVGVYGESGGYGFGVYGKGDGYGGVFGQSFNGTGVVGEGYDGVQGNGSRFGVYGVTYGTASNNYGVYGTATNGGSAFAGYFAGKVGIIGSLGNPIGNPLDVTSPITISGAVNRSYTYGYLNSNGRTGTNSNETNSYSLTASYRIAATEFNAYSDARIKHQIGRSDADNDLRTLLGIQVTDYTLLDTIAQPQTLHKKVIAQQVEQVFPQAVSRMAGVIPDIYQRAQVQQGWISLATNLKVGERVKIITDKAAAVYDVLEANAQGFRVALPDAGRVFVYGHEVKDFRTVDYEALAMLNVSATQALYRQMTRMEAETATLNAKGDRLAAMEKENAELKATLKALAERLSAVEVEQRKQK